MQEQEEEKEDFTEQQSKGVLMKSYTIKKRQVHDQLDRQPYAGSQTMRGENMDSNAIQTKLGRVNSDEYISPRAYEKRYKNGET